jgi:hypothetical protein
VAKEKFELVFLAGGAMLDAVSYRLRRKPVTAVEAVGAAMHTLRETLDEQRDQLPDPDAIEAYIAAIRTELCAEPPHRLVLLDYLTGLADQVAQAGELADDVAALRTAVTAWLGR